MRILVLYWGVLGDIRRLSIQNHLYALPNNFPEHEYLYLDTFSEIPKWLAHYSFDVIILHNSFLCLRLRNDIEALKKRTSVLANMTGVKIAIPQDEYDCHLRLDEWLLYIGIDTIFTCFPQQKQILYPKLSQIVQFEKAYPGYVNEELVNIPVAKKDKKWVFGYRARHLPFYFGSLGQQKREIGEKIKELCFDTNISANISTHQEDTIYGDDWLKFLRSCKAILGSESGSSLLISDPQLKQKVREYVYKNPQASFETVETMFFSGQDNCHRFATVSPRHFECAALKVCQVLMEGQYDGVLQPNIHYIPLKQDYSNFREVVEAVNNDKIIEAITNKAYEDLVASKKYSYHQFAKQIIDISQSKVKIPLPPLSYRDKIKLHRLKYIWAIKDRYFSPRLAREIDEMLKIYTPKLELWLRRFFKI